MTSTYINTKKWSILFLFCVCGFLPLPSQVETISSSISSQKYKKKYSSDKIHHLFLSAGHGPFFFGGGYQAVIKGYVGLEVHGSILGGLGGGVKIYPLNVQKERLDPYLSIAYQDDPWMKWKIFTPSTGLEIKFNNHDRLTLDVGTAKIEDQWVLTGNLRYSTPVSSVYKTLKKVTLADLLSALL